MAIDPVTAVKLAGTVLGFLGRRKKQETGVDYVKLRESAEAAGFNPLTALRNGGAQGFYQGPRMSSAEFLGQALGEVGNTLYSAQAAKRDEEIDNLQRDILKQELDEMRKANDPIGGKDWGFSIPHAVTTTKATQNESPALSNHLVHSGSVSNGPDVVAGSVLVSKSEGFSDAEDIETRYGDVVSWPYGMAVLAADAGKTLLPHLRGQKIAREAKRSAQEVRDQFYRPRLTYPPMYGGGLPYLQNPDILFDR